MPDRVKQGISGLQIAVSLFVEPLLIPQWTTSDTITLSDFTTITAVVGFRNDTGSALAFTISSNQITLTTAAMTNVACSILVIGSR